MKFSKCFIDLTGKTFFRLYVIKVYGKNKYGNATFLCLCSCGNKKVVNSASLISGKTKSCGCYAQEQRVNVNTTHGMGNTKIYNVWNSMRDRCNNKKSKYYAYYGGRGIKVCDSWNIFINFFSDMGETYKDGLTIDRIDNNGDYEPKNCRWITHKEQCNNRRSNRIIKFNGQIKNLTQWAESIGTNYHILKNRLKRGWTVERTLTTPVHPPI